MGIIRFINEWFFFHGFALLIAGILSTPYSAGDDEISFDPDDIIENIEEVDEGWWIGEVNGARGLFPSNYVELI